MRGREGSQPLSLLWRDAGLQLDAAEKWVLHLRSTTIFEKFENIIFNPLDSAVKSRSTTMPRVVK
jgi:hypothetical protein